MIKLFNRDFNGDYQSPRKKHSRHSFFAVNWIKRSIKLRGGKVLRFKKVEPEQWEILRVHKTNQ